MENSVAASCCSIVATEAQGFLRRKVCTLPFEPCSYILFYPTRTAKRVTSKMPPKFKDVTFNFIPVKTGLSLEPKVLRRRVMGLYRLWYRQIPIIFYDYKLPMKPEVGRSKLREIFVKNSRITDPRVIDGLIIRGQMELNESVNKQKEDCHLWKYFRTQERKPQDFLTKFLEGR